MIIIIPLGGKGERFKKLGYKQPKALIHVFGKPILFWLLDSINNFDEDMHIIIPYNQEYTNYRLESLLKKNYPQLNFEFLCLKKDTDGAAETINIALNTLTIPDQPILCLDSDNFYTFDIVKKWNQLNCVFTFSDYGDKPIYSYIDLSGCYIKNIVEKEKISDKACTGAYGFSSYKELLFYTKQIIEKNIREKNEFYTSVVIKEMIKDDILFENVNIDKKDYICLGTPLQVKQFYNNYPKISCLTNKESQIKKLRICFDLDNTLVTFPSILGDYTTVDPIQKNIDYLKYLHTFGHTIIIYTARKMRSSDGNIGKVNSSIGKITFDTLDKFEIPYDEIYFGKPYADFYIDDLAVNCFEDLEKELGFYYNFIEPRSFNQIEENSIETITKTSDNLSGEIYYYNHIPYNLKDMFPILINYDNENKTWYTVEKIKGLSLSDYYLSEILTEKLLKNVMNSIKRIQSSNIKKSLNLNIYANYYEKLLSRYTKYDFSEYKDSDKLFFELSTFLREYEDNKQGKMTVIHGDPVFTNILINDYDKIKFIDMRGCIDNKLSICGDWLYDWAKLYQSLIGYDKVLLSKTISFEYERKMINCFKEYFIEMYSVEDFYNLQKITKSLLFTLIPLHNNNKCKDYYNLIFSIY